MTRSIELGACSTPAPICSLPDSSMRLDQLLAVEDHAPVEVTWSVYQHLVAAYRNTNKTDARNDLATVIDTLACGVPKGLPELAKLGRTLNKRRADVLAYFNHPGTSNGPSEAINGRLEHLRGTPLGFHDLTNYNRRALLNTGGFTPAFHP